jgi:hypothetical protein
MSKVQFEMKWQKISLFFLTFTLALIIPFSSANAASVESQEPSLPAASAGDTVSTMGAGEWDYKGYSYTSTFYGYASGWPYYGSAVYASGYVHSGGGSFKVYASKSGYYTLTEYDPSNADDIVSTKWINAGGYAVWSNLGDYVDGDNKKAEFFVFSNVASSKVTFYD